ncbi:hypothetical protein BD311DRAFT_738733 [Dichomitus squalens]|uniref:Uncharacterized protein n=1 Tax=Dichomitus squalens TaxID=114155 RepID=A0A4Q9MQH6_9APHY|nr:hypothetical protein BD311DRAFT_738733 [Dichomitus squalens]
MTESSLQRRPFDSPGPRIPLPPPSTSSDPPTFALSVSLLPTDTSRASTSSQTPPPPPSSSRFSTAPSSSMPGVSVPGSVFSTPTSSGTTSSPTAATNFAWSSSFPQTLALCSTTTITWSYSGPQESLEFLVSPNLPPHTDSANTAKQVSTLVALAVDATLQAWNWSPVNITTGQYTLEALGYGVRAISPLFIIAGEDTSCLTASSTTSTSGARPTQGISPETNTSSLPSPVATTSATSSSPVAAASATSSTVVRSRVSTAAIAGGGAAGAGVLLATILAIYCLWRRARGRPPGAGSALSTSYNESTKRGHRQSCDPSDIHPETSIPALRSTSTAARSLPRLEPNRRPPSSLLSIPNPTIPLHMSQTHVLDENLTAPSLMDISFIGSRASVLSDATSTAALMRQSTPSSSSTSKATKLLYALLAKKRHSADMSDAGSSQWQYGSAAPSSATSQMYPVHDGDAQSGH